MPATPRNVRLLYAAYPAVLLIFCAVCVVAGDSFLRPGHAVPWTMRSSDIVRFGMVVWITCSGGLIELLFARSGLLSGSK
jgi:hypothetical protein